MTTDFQPGERVVYTGRAQSAHGSAYFGMTATVIRPIKSRKVVHIRWDETGHPTFDARPENLAKMEA